MNLARSAAIAVLLSCSLAPANAVEPANPGQSLYGITLGSSRTRAIVVAGQRLVGANRQPAHTYANGLVEDSWDTTRGVGIQTFEVFSQRGKVIQLRARTSLEGGQSKLTFAQLIRRYKLRKRVYLFDEDGGGYQCFYYDDIKRGVCFTAGTQDDFLLTYHPDAIIVHRPGVPAMAVENGVRGKPEHGSDTQAYANEAAANRARQHK